MTPSGGAGAPITARRLRDGTWRGMDVFDQILDQVHTEMRRECAALGLAISPQQGSVIQQGSVNQQPPPHPAGATNQPNQTRTPRPT